MIGSLVGTKDLKRNRLVTRIAPGHQFRDDEKEASGANI